MIAVKKMINPISVQLLENEDMEAVAAVAVAAVVVVVVSVAVVTVVTVPKCLSPIL